MSIETLVIFCVFSFFYIISPGPAIFLAISNGMSAGMKSVALSSFGNILGLLIISCISISGLGVVLTSSATAFMIIKTIGAFYLIYLGVKQFLAGRTIALNTFLPREGKITNLERRPLSYFTQGFVLAITNPKAILFFIALFPQFLSLERPILQQFLILTAIFMFLSFLSLFSYGYIGNRARNFFSNPKEMAWFHRITGGLFIGIGIGLLQLKNAQN